MKKSILMLLALFMLGACSTTEESNTDTTTPEGDTTLPEGEDGENPEVENEEEEL